MIPTIGHSEKTEQWSIRHSERTGLGGGRVNMWRSEGFRALKILCDSIMVDRFFQTHSIYNSKNEP